MTGPAFSAFGLDLPVTRQLRVCLLLGDDIQDGIRNYAGDGVAVVPEGDVGSVDGAARLGVGGRLDLGVDETLSVTAVLAMRVSQEASGVAFGSQDGVVLSASRLGLVGISKRKGREGEQARCAADLTAWGMHVFEVPRKSATRLRALTGGEVSGDEQSSDRVAAPGSRLFLGPMTVGHVDIALFCLYDGMLDPAEVYAVRAWAQEYCASIGIAI